MNGREYIKSDYNSQSLSTKRNHLQRMGNLRVNCMNEDTYIEHQG